MKNLAHSASFDSDEKDAPSKPGIKHEMLRMRDAEMLFLIWGHRFKSCRGHQQFRPARVRLAWKLRDILGCSRARFVVNFNHRCDLW